MACSVNVVRSSGSSAFVDRRFNQAISDQPRIIKKVAGRPSLMHILTPDFKILPLSKVLKGGQPTSWVYAL